MPNNDLVQVPEDFAGTVFPVYAEGPDATPPQKRRPLVREYVTYLCPTCGKATWEAWAVVLKRHPMETGGEWAQSPCQTNEKCLADWCDGSHNEAMHEAIKRSLDEEHGPWEPLD